jgi:carbonic anhydrase
MADIQGLLQNARRWEERFDKPLPLGANARITIVTCMDSRLIPEEMFGLGLGDAEVIRNAGGRVNWDVIRSVVVTHDILKCTDIFLIHHTDCGAMHAARQRPRLLDLWSKRLGWIFGTALKLAAVLHLDAFLVQPIHNLEQSVRDDVRSLALHPLVPKDMGIYGFTYDVTTGKFSEVTRQEPRAPKPKSF